MTKKKHQPISTTKPIIVEEFSDDERALYADLTGVLGTHITHNRLTHDQAENVFKTLIHNLRLVPAVTGEERHK